MKSKVKITKSPEQAIKALEKLNKAMRGKESVKVGLPKGSNDYPDGTSVIMVGTVQEFGSPSRGIPQRSYLRSTIQEKRRPYKRMFARLAKQIIDGKIDKVQALGLVGLQVQTDVREKITDISEPALVSREGNPLVDTGHLRQSITFEVTS
tara:strand:+ start:17594 stop:18046 length:453 start_codon:yes stop_codon:yes gene_type:complete